MNEIEARQRRAELVRRMRQIVDAANGRELTRAQARDLSAVEAEFDDISLALGQPRFRDLPVRRADGSPAERRTDGHANPAGQVAAAERYMSQPAYDVPRPVLDSALPQRRLWKPGDVLTLRSNERLSDLVRPGEDAQAEPLRFGHYLRGIVTGNWSGAEAEKRAMSISTAGAGGYLVPAPLATSLIDRARNVARVIQAGAVTVPMTANTLDMARITGDPTASWHVENAAVTASDMSFDRVTLTAHTLVALVKASVELIDDAPNMANTVEAALSSALGLELDRVSLRGSGVAPEPLGILNQSGVTLQSLGANGGALTDFDAFLTAIGDIRSANFEPNAAIYAPRTATSLSKLKDSTNQPLRMPDDFAALRRLSTNQVPVNLTQGTATNASEAYVGQWDQLLIGMRTQLVLEVSREAADSTSSAFTNLQVWIRAFLRADCQLAHPAAFEIIQGIIP